MGSVFIFVIETERLTLSALSEEDAEFILLLLNDPDWIRFIGDRNVRTLDDARAYLVNGPIAMQERCGHSLILVQTKTDGSKIGICGLIKRDTLDCVDLGYVLLPAYRGKGYALEAAEVEVSVRLGFDKLNLNSILAITSQNNCASIQLLRKLNFVFERTIQFDNDDETLNLYRVRAPTSQTAP